MTNFFGLLANVTVVTHLAFVVFVVLGGLLTLRWPRVAWVHLPCVAWGTLVELTGWVCPLTPLERGFQERAGTASYATSFLEHYVVPLLYPGELTRTMQVGIGVGVVALNAVVYFLAWRRREAAS